MQHIIHIMHKGYIGHESLKTILCLGGMGA